MAKGGEAAYQCLVRGTELALAKKVDAIVTCPLHKVALHLAGHDWPGTQNSSLSYAVCTTMR